MEQSFVGGCVNDELSRRHWHASETRQPELACRTVIIERTGLCTWCVLDCLWSWCS